MDWINNLASLSNKIQLSLKPIDLLANSGIYSISNKLNMDIFNMFKNDSSYIDRLIRPSYNLSQLFEASNQLNRLTKATDVAIYTNSIVGIANSGFLIGKKYNPAYFNNSIYNLVNDNIQNYNKHLSLSNQIAKSFSGAINLNSKLEYLFNDKNYLSSKHLNGFDVLSGISFLQSLSENESDIDDTYSEIESLVTENANLKETIISLQSTIIALQKGSPLDDNNQNWYKLKHWSSYVEWFMNKILIQKFKLSYRVANTICVLVILGMPILIYDIAVEGFGGDIYNAIVRNTPPQKEITKEIVKYIDHPQQINDFVIREAPIYLCKSTKTKKIGFLPQNATVYIIKIVNGWCLVQADVVITKPNNNRNRKRYNQKKGPITVTKTVNGWIEKENLDMFQ